ncbi:hypothetical protein BWQ96_08030 [Gracilariopsis chorda]|uniref:Retrovirus-related Pol polyprotein from transposon TNT 1-94-like beta-barrel domain-containing protein n=1 Tax=Gracilariopsis chorda TaxID=448386 RepID=A0A2V3IJK1_9FLOR|nr:hypothetical protein BWQ96_08030 [Gracilariopsis chorda]|eukprot:PXF42252.1 hypothetical protein BWQ96_08030 [Gracilariopsis chorda]
MRGLPDEYSTTKEIIRGLEKSYQQELAILIQKEVELRQDDGKEEDVREHGMPTKGNTERSSYFVHGRGKCYHCGKPFHKMDRCWEIPDSKCYRGNGIHKKKPRKMNQRPERDDKYMAGLLLYAHGSEVQHTSCHEEGQGLVAKYQRAPGASRKWYLDSGASKLITNSCQNFDGEVLKPHSTKISVGSGEILDVKRMGTIQCKVMENGVAIRITLREVHYISKMACILVSVSAIR